MTAHGKYLLWTNKNTALSTWCNIYRRLWTTEWPRSDPKAKGKDAGVSNLQLVSRSISIRHLFHSPKHRYGAKLILFYITRVRLRTVKSEAFQYLWIIRRQYLKTTLWAEYLRLLKIKIPGNVFCPCNALRGIRSRRDLYLCGMYSASSDLASVDVKMFSFLIYFTQKCNECCTLDAIREDNAAINCITVQHKSSFP
jgi:hypothetical protein